MNAMKICIIVLVLIGVLAMCGIGASFTGGNDTNNGTPEPWVETLRNVAAKPRTLRTDELRPNSPDCQLQDALPVGRECSYTIARSGDLLGATRKLLLTLTQGGGASIVLRQEDYLTAKANLTPSEPNADLDVFKEKTETPSVLGIICKLPPACSFTLRE